MITDKKGTTWTWSWVEVNDCLLCCVRSPWPQTRWWPRGHDHWPDLLHQDEAVCLQQHGWNYSSLEWREHTGQVRRWWSWSWTVNQTFGLMKFASPSPWLFCDRPRKDWKRISPVSSLIITIIIKVLVWSKMHTHTHAVTQATARTSALHCDSRVHPVSNRSRDLAETEPDCFTLVIYVYISFMVDWAWDCKQVTKLWLGTLENYVVDCGQSATSECRAQQHWLLQFPWWPAGGDWSAPLPHPLVPMWVH